MSRLYQNVGAVHPSRSMFDLSYEKKLTCDMGQLIPVMCDEVVPGDLFQIGNQAIIRFQPLVAPILHEINMFVHYFSSRIESCGTIGKSLFQAVYQVTKFL